MAELFTTTIFFCSTTTMTVLLNFDVVRIILCYARDQDPVGFLLACRVSRVWYEAAMSIAWENPPGGSLSPILSLLPEYTESAVSRSARCSVPRIKLIQLSMLQRYGFVSKSPDTGSWKRFQSLAGERIQTLVLDLSTVRPLDILAQVQSGCPTQFTLPNLQKLSVSMDDDEVHVVFATRFFQASVKVFAVELYPQATPAWNRGPPVSSRHLSNNEVSFRDRLEADRFFRARFGAPRSTDLSKFFNDIKQKMPQITQVLVHTEVAPVLNAWAEFLAMLQGLKVMETVALSRPILSLTLLCALASHPTLRAITSYGANFPIWGESPSGWIFWESGATGLSCYDSHGILPSKASFPHLQHVAFACSLRHLQTTLQSVSLRALKHIRSLHVDTSGTSAVVTREAELTDFLKFVADSWPEIEELRVGPLQGEDYDDTWCISRANLYPLAACSRLRTLEVEAAFPTQLTSDDLEDLVCHWPELRHLILDNAYTRPIPDENTTWVELDSALDVVQRCCPHLETLSLYVTPALDVAEHHPVLSLKTVALLFDSYRDYDPDEVARFLRASLPGTCALAIDDAGLYERKDDHLHPATEEVWFDPAMGRFPEVYYRWLALTREDGLKASVGYSDRIRREVTCLARV